MRILITAGPTREYIDAVRFVSNASSGRMGCAVAAAARRAGHEVTLLAGPIGQGLPASAAQAGCSVVPFVSVTDLSAALAEHFAACDALVMAAAVGDFRVDKPAADKIRRQDGPVTIRLTPTGDVLAAVTGAKRPGQGVVAFAVEQPPRGQAERKAREKLIAKGADYVVVNTPAAFDADGSLACILSRRGVVLPWADRPKESLADQIVTLLESMG